MKILSEGFDPCAFDIERTKEILSTEENYLAIASLLEKGINPDEIYECALYVEMVGSGDYD